MTRGVRPSPATLEAIRRDLSGGLRVNDIRRRHHVSAVVIARLRREMAAAAGRELLDGYAPRFGTCPPGHLTYWTRECVLQGLRLAAAELDVLPTTSNVYDRLKRGRMDWPVSEKIREYFGGMARGWLAAGVSRRRVQLTNSAWTAKEDEYLLTMAGAVRLVGIAKTLNRSYQAVRVRIGSKGFHLKARQNQGYLTAAELSKEYGSPYHRVREFLTDGRLKGRYRATLHRWEIDPGDVTEEMIAALRRPKGTHKRTSPDVGDYYERYGIRRIAGRASGGLGMTEKTALNVLMEALPYLRHSVKFYRFQRPGREFWPNREEVEGTIRDAEIVLQDGGKRPKIVTLCGSTRFGEAFDRANLEETLAGGRIGGSNGYRIGTEG